MVEPQPDNITDMPHPATPESSTAESAVILHAVHAVERPEAVNHGGSVPGTLSFQQSLRPVLQGVEAMVRAQSKHVDALDRVEKVMMHQTGVPKILAEAKVALEQRNVVNRAMFEALHGELKTYKDAFLLEAVLRPVIRDIIALYDDISEIHHQFALALSTQEQRGCMTGGALMFFETVAAPAKALEHNRDSILEVLERLDVVMLPSGTGKLDGRTQRAVTVELTEDPEQDHQVVKVIRRGFMWKDRVIRAEEVVIKRCAKGQPGAPVPKPPKP